MARESSSWRHDGENDPTSGPMRLRTRNKAVNYREVDDDEEEEDEEMTGERSRKATAVGRGKSQSKCRRKRAGEEEEDFIPGKAVIHGDDKYDDDDAGDNDDDVGGNDDDVCDNDDDGDIDDDDDDDFVIRKKRRRKGKAVMGDDEREEFVRGKAKRNGKVVVEGDGGLEYCKGERRRKIGREVVDESEDVECDGKEIGRREGMRSERDWIDEEDENEVVEKIKTGEVEDGEEVSEEEVVGEFDKLEDVGYESDRVTEKDKSFDAGDVLTDDDGHGEREGDDELTDLDERPESTLEVRARSSRELYFDDETSSDNDMLSQSGSSQNLRKRPNRRKIHYGEDDSRRTKKRIVDYKSKESLGKGHNSRCT